MVEFITGFGLVVVIWLLLVAVSLKGWVTAAVVIASVIIGAHCFPVFAAYSNIYCNFLHIRRAFRGKDYYFDALAPPEGATSGEG